ncbi:hypothetical protein PR048_028291 [Dryococelus australis]|uniref:CHK kinase-like domain-containing protein n=1 Tax=Dryococelus australis TaxID=614101 RepID=A0ABQ9GIW9_9NEOP|nr:hypothetical protein PR048_028291 [Dryococelus australis]
MSGNWKGKLQKVDLEKLLGQDVVSFKATILTEAGDNYGSIMLAVDVILHSEKELNLVAKIFPQLEETRVLFKSPLSMRKEIDMYKLVSPEFDKIQEEHSVPLSERLHIFCHCPGARLTLQGYDDRPLADEDSILLLENLKVQGYRVADRVLGQDLTHAELVMTDLAKFHATGIAIKLRKPEVFRNKLMKACEAFKIRISSLENDHLQGKNFVESLRRIPICEQKINLIYEHIKNFIDYSHSDEFRYPTEIFGTIIHDDLWTNNMMFKYRSVKDNDPIGVKIYDFQVVRYGSPLTDVIFYLFTSTITGIVTKHLDMLLKLYYNSFVDWLKILGCDTTEFQFNVFLGEVKSAAQLELIHILYWLFPITLHKDQLEEFKTGSPHENVIDFNEDFIQKARDTITVFSERNWL